MKRLTFYSNVYDFTAESFVEKVNSIDSKDELKIHFSSGGGSVFAGWPMASVIADRKGKTILKVEGVAASMGFVLALFADEVEALDVANFMVHRATVYVDNEDDQKILDSINKTLRKKIEKRIDVEKFEEITGVSIKDIFEAEKRRDVWLSAKDAKKIGLVHKISRLDPKNPTAYADKFIAFIDEEHGSNSLSQGSEIRQFNNNKPKKELKMDLKELKNKHPEVYAQAVNEGLEAGSKKEFIRVVSHLAFIDVDKDAVVKAIREKAEFNTAFSAEMQVKMFSKAKLEALETGDLPTGGDVPKTPEAKTKEELEVEAFQKQLLIDAGVEVKEDK